MRNEMLWNFWKFSSTAVKKLIAAGYLRNIQGNQYVFSEIPKEKEALDQNDTTLLSENHIRNNTYNTVGAAAGDIAPLARTLYLPSTTVEVGGLCPGGPKPPGEPDSEEEIKRIDPSWLRKQMNRCMPIGHVRDDIIQLGSGKMYRVTDWDAALYDVVMQYADQCNAYIERNRKNPKLQAFLTEE